MMGGAINGVVAPLYLTKGENMSIYESLKVILTDGIYGGGVLTASQELALELATTLGCIALVALPFYVLYKVVSRFL